MKASVSLFFCAIFISFFGKSQCDEYYINGLISGSDEKCLLPEGSPIRFCPRLKGVSLNGYAFDTYQWNGITTQYITLSKDGGIAGTLVLKLEEKEFVVNLNGCGGSRTYSISFSQQEHNLWVANKSTRDKEKADKLKREEEQKIREEQQKLQAINQLIENAKKQTSIDNQIPLRVYYSVEGYDSIGYFDTIGVGVMNWFDANNICPKIGEGWRLPTLNELNLIKSQFNYSSREMSLWTSTYFCMDRRVYEGEKCSDTSYASILNWSNGVVDNRGASRSYMFNVMAIRPEKFKTVNNLEIMNKDLENVTLETAVRIAKEIGDGWRLPTYEELIIMYNNRKEIGNFKENTYLSSSSWVNEFYKEIVYVINFAKGKGKKYNYQKVNSENDKFLYVRLVRDKK
jgi:hypothetical protein